MSPQVTDGKWLEYLTSECARLIAEWDIKDVWLWEDWPDLKKYYKNRTDLGVDVVACRGSDGELIAIQCKSRQLSDDGMGAPLTFKELSTFIGLSADKRWAERWVVTNGNVSIGDNAISVAGREKPLKLFNLKRASCKTSESGYFLKNLDFFGVWLSLTNLGWGTRWGMDPRFFFERVGICPQSLKARGWKPPNFVFSGHPKVQQKMEVSMSLTDKIRRCYITCQQELFPWLETQMGSLPKRYQTLVLVLEMVCVEDHLRGRVRGRYGGRPPAHRVTLARTFIAKMVLNIPTTSGLRERLLMDKVLRSICGWSSDQDVPSESTFSRAFKEFSQMQLPNRIHMALIKKGYEGELVGHISRDSTAIEARQKPVPKKKEAESAPKKRKRGRPKKGEERPKQERRRMEKQLTMEMDEMLEDLPKDCTVGCKRNAKGHTHKWTGFKLHMDTADGGIPISCVVTSASVHDSQVAIPLARITEQRVTHCYDLMDSAYDAKEVYAQSENSGRCARLTGKM